MGRVASPGMFFGIFAVKQGIELIIFCLNQGYRFIACCLEQDIFSCSSAISTLEGIENKQRLQTLSTDNAWSNKNFLFYLTFRMLQHTSSEVNGYNCYKHFKKIQK